MNLAHVLVQRECEGPVWHAPHKLNAKFTFIVLTQSQPSDNVGGSAATPMEVCDEAAQHQHQDGFIFSAENQHPKNGHTAEHSDAETMMGALLIVSNRVACCLHKEVDNLSLFLSLSLPPSPVSPSLVCLPDPEWRLSRMALPNRLIETNASFVSR